MTRNKTIKIRLTNEELLRLKALAGKRGVSAWLRSRALGPDRRQQQTERLVMLSELARGRNILNQIARSSERRAAPEQIQIVTQLIAVERALSRFKET